MAYPYQFNPYQFQPQMPTYQPQMQSYPQPQQPVFQSSMIWVSGIEEVKSYPTAPNTVLPFYDNDGKTEYWKQTDASGRASIRIFDRIDRSAQPGEQKPAPELATKEDLEKVITAISGIETLLRGDAENA